MNQILPGGYTKTREYDMRGIMIPHIGDIIYYDTIDRQLVIQESNDKRFMNNRYISIGVIYDISDDLKTVKLITLYLISISFNFNEKISEKNLIKQIKSTIRSYLKDIFKNDIPEDMSYSLITKNDLTSVILNSNIVFNSLSELPINDKLKDKKITDIIKSHQLLYLDKDKLMITYNIKDNFNNLSTENKELMLNIENKYSDIKKDYINKEKKYLNKVYIIPTISIKLD